MAINDGNGTGTVTGTTSSDVIYGGNGKDTLGGGDGNDLLFGGNGDDTLIGGAGDDQLDGGNGKDTAVFSGILNNYSIGQLSDGSVRVRDMIGTDGTDIIVNVSYFRFADGTVKLEDLPVAAVLAANNQGGFDIKLNDASALDPGLGSPGIDNVSYNGAGEVALPANVENVTLTGTADSSATGNELDNTIIGNAGDNTLAAGGGNDILDGGDGDDTLIGGSGAGDDIYIGGAGIDTVVYSSATQGIFVDLAAGTASGPEIGNDTLIGIENVVGGSGNDDIRGDNGANQLFGGSGNDMLSGRGGDDLLNGGDGIDEARYALTTQGITVDLAAGTASGPEIGNDTLIGIENVVGGSGNDTIRGNIGDNQLFGGDGNDFLVGRGGNDTLNGGNGIDIAAYTGSRADYSFSAGSVMGTQLVTEIVSGAEDTTSSVELLQFNGSDTIADSYQLGYGNTPINLTVFGLAGGVSLFGRGVTDLLTMGTNANFRLIDLGAGVDTLTLGTTNASYFLNLANVENLVGSSGNNSVGMTTSVGTSNMLVDLGFGNDTLSLSGGNNVVSVTNVETVTAFGGANTVFFLHNNGSVNQSFNLGSSGDGPDRLYLQGSNSNYELSSIVGDMTVIGDSLSDNETVSMFNTVTGATFDLGSGNDSLTLNSNSVIGPASNVVFVQNVETVTAIGDKSDFIHILDHGGTTTVTAGGGPDMIWAGAGEDHFRFTGTGNSPDIPFTQGQKDVIDGFNASHDKFVFDGIVGTALTWELTTWAGADLVRVDFDDNAVGNFGWDIAIQVDNLTGTLTNANFEWVI